MSIEIQTGCTMIFVFGREKRPDSTTCMSQFSNCPNKERWSDLQHILRYLVQTKKLNLTFQKIGKNIEIFCDFDWSGDKIDRSSFSDYVALLSDGGVLWNEKK